MYFSSTAIRTFLHMSVKCYLWPSDIGGTVGPH